MRRERGAALLLALLLAALVATMSASALWRQWRNAEVEAADRVRTQSAWLLSGALDWARLILREDARAGAIDHLAEPWALPLSEAELSASLAAQRDAFAQGEADGNPDTFLSGQIIDLQSRLNLSNLAVLGQMSEPNLRAFARLFDLLALSPAELERLAEAMRLASLAATDGELPAQAPVAPLGPADLAWLGLASDTVARLAPHVTVLPARTPINLNTAGAEVIYSALEGISLTDAQRLVAAREQSPFRTPSEAMALLERPNGAADGRATSVTSRFFEVQAKLRRGRSVVQENTLVQRDSPEVVVLQRRRSQRPAR